MNKEWYVFKGTHHLGPFSVEEIEEFYRSGEINAQTLIWIEGVETFERLSKIHTFQYLFHKNSDAPKSVDAPPPPPNIPKLPKVPSEASTHRAEGQVELFDNELPPPIPLDALLDPKGLERRRIKSEEKKFRLSKISLSIGLTLFAVIMTWYALTQRDAGIELRIKGLMPVYLERLEMTATKKTPRFEVAMALSLDGLTLWGSTNYPGDILVNMQLKSISKKVLGTEDVTVMVKGEFKNHTGKFTRMILTHGSKFLPGEYTVHVEGHEKHFLNKNLKFLSGINFFKSLNKTYSFEGTTLIYAGIPREFDKRLSEYSANVLGEILKPYQDKLERVQTFEAILNSTSQNYFMALEKAKSGKDIALFERQFIKETSPLLQALVLKANELSKDPKVNEEAGTTPSIAPYREQVALGKQIGEMASDMITKSEKFKKITDKDKTNLKTEFDKRAKDIKLQIDINVKKLEEQIQKISQ